MLKNKINININNGMASYGLGCLYTISHHICFLNKIKRLFKCHYHQLRVASIGITRASFITTFVELYAVAIAINRLSTASSHSGVFKLTRKDHYQPTDNRYIGLNTVERISKMGNLCIKTLSILANIHHLITM